MKLLNISLAATCAAAIAFQLASCSRSEGEASDNTITFSHEVYSTHYRLLETAKAFDNDNDVLFRDSTSLLLPQKIYGTDVAALRDTIMLAAFDTVASPREAIKSFFRKTVEETGYQYAEVADSVPSTDIDGISIVEGDVFNMSPRLLTYAITNYTYYPGAAHGLTGVTYISYLLDENRVMTLSDLFTPEGLEALPAIINSRAKQLKPAIGPTDQITKLPSGGNFYISLSDAITFVYQPYEVASYSQGLIQISFYPTELTEYLSPEGLNYFQLN